MTSNDKSRAEIAAELEAFSAGNLPDIRRWYDGLKMNSVVSQGHLRTVEDCLQQQLFIKVVFAETALGLRPWLGEEMNGMAAMLARDIILKESPVFLWRDELRLAAMSDRRPLPDHIVDYTDVPYRTMLWLWEFPLETEEDNVVSFGMFLVFPKTARIHEGIVFSIDGAHTHGTVNDRITLGIFGLPKPGMRYPQEMETDKKHYEDITRAIAFVNSPYIDHSMRRATRAETRRLTKQNLSNTAHFIRLRRALPSGTKSEVEGSNTVEWGWRWIVTGHYRHQWYPSEKRNRLIWIAPYVKGPEDKPLKQRAYNVVR